MIESVGSIGALLEEKIPFLIMYAGYLYGVFRMYHWLMKNTKPRYVRQK